jgi:hypothetical protein
MRLSSVALIIDLRKSKTLKHMCFRKVISLKKGQGQVSKEEEIISVLQSGQEKFLHTESSIPVTNPLVVGAKIMMWYNFLVEHKS